MEEYGADKFDSFSACSYDQAIHELAVDGGDASIWAMCGLASVLRRSIVSVYPSTINGTHDELAKHLNRTMRPRLSPHEPRETIYIMWTRNVANNPGTMWQANHFVPLMGNELNMEEDVMDGGAQMEDDMDIGESVWEADGHADIGIFPVSDQSTMPSLSSSAADNSDNLESTRLPAPRSASPLLTSSQPVPVPAPRSASSLLTSSQPVPVPAPRSVSSASTGGCLTSGLPELIEAHKGGLRLLLDGYCYVRASSNSRKNVCAFILILHSMSIIRSQLCC